MLCIYIYVYVYVHSKIYIYLPVKKIHISKIAKITNNLKQTNEELYNAYRSLLI